MLRELAWLFRACILRLKISRFQVGSRGSVHCFCFQRLLPWSSQNGFCLARSGPSPGSAVYPPSRANYPSSRPETRPVRPALPAGLFGHRGHDLSPSPAPLSELRCRPWCTCADAHHGMQIKGRRQNREGSCCPAVERLSFEGLGVYCLMERSLSGA